MLKATTTEKVFKYKSSKDKDEFAKELRKRVNKYFKENKISKKANVEVILKGVLAFLLWFVIYGVILSGKLNNSFILIIASFLSLGLINVFIAFNIMHDANHKAYSKQDKWNIALGYTMNFVGGNSYLFTMMHNVHHSFVNIAHMDVTMETHGVFRFTPAEKWKPFHKYQHIYVPILYSLAHIHWVLVKDYKWMFGETNIGNNKQIQHSLKEYIILFVSKALYYALTLVIPILVVDVPWWWITIAWINLHIIPGLMFALLFQCTHVYEGTHYPLPDDEGVIHNNYFVHVLETTSDFSVNSYLMSWFTGGINLHVAHHLFPDINHVHYFSLTPIIRKCAEEYGIQYQDTKNFSTAVSKHFKMLKHLSNKDGEVSQYNLKNSNVSN